MHVGLFFGSFNPIHYGHLVIASYMLNFHSFNQIWFIISPQNPLKDSHDLIEEKLRLEMLELAISNSDNLKVLDIEFNLPKPSYTFNTLNILKQTYRGNKFSLIVGYDNILSFDRWKNYNQILENHKIYVYPRIVDNMDKGLISHESIILTNAPIIEISSSSIRKAISRNIYPDYFTTKEVYNFIKAKKLYTR